MVIAIAVADFMRTRTHNNKRRIDPDSMDLHFAGYFSPHAIEQAISLAAVAANNRSQDSNDNEKGEFDDADDGNYDEDDDGT